MPISPKSGSSPCDACGETDVSQRAHLLKIGQRVGALFGPEAEAGASLVRVRKLTAGELALCGWCMVSCNQVFGDPVREHFAPVLSKIDRIRDILRETDDRG